MQSGAFTRVLITLEVAACRAHLCANLGSSGVEIAVEIRPRPSPRALPGARGPHISSMAHKQYAYSTISWLRKPPNFQLAR